MKSATVHLNAWATQSNKLVVYLSNGDKEVATMYHPSNLGYGRWTSTTFEFSGLPIEGEWTVRVEDEGGGNLNVEWAQLMLGATEDADSMLQYGSMEITHGEAAEDPAEVSVEDNRPQ